MKVRFTASNTMLACRAHTLMRLWQKFSLLLLLAPAATGHAQVPSAAAPESWPDWMVRLLAVRKAEQFQLAKEFKAFYGFQFSNEIERSGITFEHHIVDDCGRDLKPIIYDHGTGLAAADVDGDGKTDLYFVNQIGGCQLWRNIGNGKFENITASAGVGLDDKVCVSASFADLDNDGDPDLFVTTVKMGNVLFENLGGGKFRNVSKESNLDYIGHSSGTTFFDFDNDGLLDVFVTNVGIYTTDKKGRGGYYIGVAGGAMKFTQPERQEPSILYKNLGGLKFKEVSKEMNLQHVGTSGDAAFGDVNEDGFPDLYVVCMEGPNKFYENQKGKGFVEKAQSYFPRTPSGAMGLKFFDYNQDGKLDLYITDMHSDMTKPQVKASNWNLSLAFEKAKSETWCGLDWTPEERISATNRMIYGNAFYQKSAPGRFTEVSDQIGVETFWPWGPSVGDLNADGYDDVFVTAGMGYPLRYSINSVLLNEGGRRFFDAEFLVNVEPRAGNKLMKKYFTVNCSGEDKENPLCYGKTGIVTVYGARSSRSSVIYDLDDDGDLDIVVAEFNDRPQVLINNLTSKRPVHFLKIKLIGTVSNRDGLGATVRVKAGGRSYTQYHDGKSGYISQSSLPLYFGLSDATKVDGVEITWPSGARQSIVSDIGINRLVEIKEPREAVRPGGVK